MIFLLILFFHTNFALSNEIMNNYKKVGISALDGSLAAFSAQAVEMTASGSAKVTYFNNNTDEVTGNPFGMNTSLAFSGSGEVNGYATTLTIVNNDANSGLSSASLTVDMGDMGKLRFAGRGASGNGAVGAWDDKTPAANEESWDIKGGGGETGPVAQQKTNDSFIYTNNMIDGVTVMLNYKPGETTHDSTTGGGIAFTGMEGLNVGAAMEDNNTTDGAVVENTVFYATYAMDAFTIGFQANESDSQTANSDTEFEAWGVSYAVSEDISISYGSSTVEFESGASKSDQEADAIGVSWTNGSMSVTASRHDIANVAGTSTDDRDVTEVNLTFAF